MVTKPLAGTLPENLATPKTGTCPTTWVAPDKGRSPNTETVPNPLLDSSSGITGLFMAHSGMFAGAGGSLVQWASAFCKII
ncbi:unnamed protein product [Pieris brassicae]|uniref:Uncharacterized protein n=1 Tax=Pieris brassicae TaxID=7116 RepID=A0A9P0TPL2_PIEBR|nr:unnamed protein product [Pieris brassicae]